MRQPVSTIVRFFTILLIPAALLGVPAEVIAIVLPLHLFMQFWYHTRHIKTLGFLEYVLVTPSHHRVHHGSNEKYIDKNYGNLLIIWDKMFGTFEPEIEPVKFGLVKNVDTFNPIKITFMGWSSMFKDIKNSQSVKEAIYLFFGPPLKKNKLKI